jgi:hypothetical protein
MGLKKPLFEHFLGKKPQKESFGSGKFLNFDLMKRRKKWCIFFEPLNKKNCHFLI